MRKLITAAYAGASLLTLTTPAFAQEDPGAPGASEEGEIIVTARRRDEDLQEVPLVVQALSSQSLEKLNIREFKDIQTLVPGLSMAQDANGIGSRTTLRGIAYDVNASGNNGTVEFYLNDAPLSAGILFQSMFDIGQIEVLRGPQGTLRGRASPSGSITVTTRRPNLSEWGASINGTVNTWGNGNLQGAINLPVVKDVFAVRIAGVFDENDDNRVYSINFSDPQKRPNRRTKGIRASAALEPIDGLKLFGSYTYTKRNVTDFDQVESANLLNPALAASPVTITAHDRLAVLRSPRLFQQVFQVYNWQAEYKFAGQKLNYVGSHNSQNYDSTAPNDVGAALPASTPFDLRTAAQITATRGKQTNHEVRLSSDERIAGIFDYVAGVMWNNLSSPSVLDVQTPVFLFSVNSPLLLNRTAVVRTGSSWERSFFGNVTAHLGERAEISGGVRGIRYRSTGGLLTNGVAVAAANEDRTIKATIWSASAKYRFTPDLMAYFNFGTSWRPGSATNAIQLRNQSTPFGDLAALYYPGDEKSKSYEVGIKSSWLDRRLRLNANYFHQTFTNFAYAPQNIFYLANNTGVNSVATATSIAVGVPAKVDGFEAEIGFKASSRWTIDATLAYSKSKISSARVPCNNYGGGVPSASQLLTANNGQQVAMCNVSDIRAGLGAPFVATVQSEYTLPVNNRMDAYLRGLMTYSGNSLNDPANAYDDIPSYALVNLYAGIRGTNGNWEIGAYAKNLFNVERVLTRSATGVNSGASVVGGAAPASTYRSITMTAGREIGFTARFSIGSR